MGVLVKHNTIISFHEDVKRTRALEEGHRVISRVEGGTRVSQILPKLPAIMPECAVFTV